MRGMASAEQPDLDLEVDRTLRPGLGGRLRHALGERVVGVVSETDIVAKESILSSDK